MATVLPDGAPVTVACWYEYQPGGHVLLSMADTARRLDHLRHNPNVAMTILGDDWYQHVSLLGRVIEIREDHELVDMDRLSMHYWGTPYPDREAFVSVVVEVTRWHTNRSPAADGASQT
jgi:general stress protein 26